MSIKLYTHQDADFDANFEARLQETSRQTGVSVEALRQLVDNFNAAVFVPENKI